MPFDVAEAIDLVSEVVGDERVRVCVGESVKGGLAVGCAATAGGLLFGPIGLAIGGALGGIGAAVSMRDNFMPLAQALALMSPDKKQQVTARVQRIAHELNVTDVAALGLMLAGNHDLRTRVATELITFLTQEMRVAIA